MAEVQSITANGYIVEDGNREYHIDIEDGVATAARVVVYNPGSNEGASEEMEPDIPTAVADVLTERGFDVDGHEEEEDPSEDDDGASDAAESVVEELEEAKENEDYVELDEAGDADDEEYVCDECGRTFDSKPALAGHGNAHRD